MFSNENYKLLAVAQPLPSFFQIALINSLQYCRNLSAVFGSGFGYFRAKIIHNTHYLINDLLIVFHIFIYQIKFSNIKQNAPQELLPEARSGMIMLSVSHMLRI